MASRAADRQATAATFRALQDGRPLSIEEALDFGLPGWSLVCNRCGSYGAEWVQRQRPGWGALALCEPHKVELLAEIARHDEAMRELRRVNFEQPSPATVEAGRRRHAEQRSLRS